MVCLLLPAIHAHSFVFVASQASQIADSFLRVAHDSIPDREYRLYLHPAETPHPRDFHLRLAYLVLGSVQGPTYSIQIVAERLREAIPVSTPQTMRSTNSRGYPPSTQLPT